MANMFDENGNYNKTEWKPGDRITAGKLNKIEESLEAINNNDIERHKEADERLDALEEQNEVVEERFDELEDLVADNKSEVDTAIYEVHSKMDRLEQEMNDGIDTVEAIAHTVDDKIAEADASMKAQVNQGKADMEAIAHTVDDKIAEADASMKAQVNQGKADMEAMVAEVEQDISDMNARIDDTEAVIDAFEDDLINRMGGFYGENFAGKVFMVGEDGYLVLDDVSSGGSSYPVVGVVDDDNNITLSSDELPDGLYTLRYSDGVEYKLIGTVLVGERKVTSINATKGKTTYEIGETLTTNDIVVTAHFNDLTSEVVTGYAIDSSSVKMNAEGNYTIIITYENCTTSIPIAVMNMSVTGNLFVASTCTLNKRVSSSGEVKDQSDTFLTDFIEIGNCMAIGGENIIHWRGFHIYKITSNELSDAGVENNSVGGAYKGVAYYDATGKFLGHDSLYTENKTYDSEGNYQLVLNASYTTATKIRIFAATLPPAASVSELSNCQLTLNQLISEI